jgi:hypothetical protein
MTDKEKAISLSVVMLSILQRIELGAEIHGMSRSAVGEFRAPNCRA